MLKARIVTAVTVLCLFLAALFFLPSIFWMVLLLALTATGSWEWTRLAGFSLNQSFAYLLITVLLGGELLFLLSNALRADPFATSFLWIYAASSVFWILAVPFLLKTKRPVRNRSLLALMGWRPVSREALRG